MSPAFAAVHLLDNTEFVIGTASLIAVLLSGAVVLWWLDRWRKKQTGAALESTESLTHFRALFERGELSEPEYQRIRDRVANQMRQEVGLRRPAVAPQTQLGPPTQAQGNPPDPTP